MTARIDKARRDGETVAVDDAGVGGSGEGTDVGDSRAGDEHIALPGRSAGAVDDRAAFQEDRVHAGYHLILRLPDAPGT
jgi:hypothetical protein